MTLSRSSALHYWSSRYGVIPIIGGKPTFSRNSAGSVGDSRGELYSAIVNTPRASWEVDKATTALERRAALLLELARTNNIPFSTDFVNAAWTKNTMAVTGGYPDPEGGTRACMIQAGATGSSIYQTLAAGASLQRANTIWMRRRSGTGNVAVLRSDGSTYDSVVPTANWQRLSALLNVASTSRWHGVLISVASDAVDIFNAQQEDGTFNTSDVVNTGAGAGSRAADAFSWAFPPAPQGLMIFTRHVERGTLAASGRLWEISSAADADPRYVLYANGGVYTSYYANGTGASSVPLGVAPAIGDTVDLLATLNPANQNIGLVQSINGGAVTAVGAAGPSGAFAAAWSAPTLWINSVGASIVGASALLDFRAVRWSDVVSATDQGRMDELRGYELTPSGDQL